MIGFAVFGRAVAGQALATFTRSAEDLASTVSPGWAAGEAHLGGKPGAEQAPEKKVSKELDALEQEIATRKDR